MLTDGEVPFQCNAIRLCVIGHCEQLSVQLVLYIVHKLQALVMVLPRLAQSLQHLLVSLHGQDQCQSQH